MRIPKSMHRLLAALLAVITAMSLSIPVLAVDAAGA